MAQITLADLRLSEHTLDTMPRLAGLREQAASARAEVCVERARHVTTYLRDLADPGDPQLLRDAKAVRCFLSNKAPRFFDANLLAGTTTSKRFGAPVYPELAGMAIWPELDTLGTREKNPLRLTPEEAGELNLKIFPYWMDRSLLEATRHRCGSAAAMGLMPRIASFIGSQAGTRPLAVPWYRVVLEQGLDGIIAEAAARESALRGARGGRDAEGLAFHQAVQEVLSGLIAYAANLGRFASLLAAGEENAERRGQLQAMAEVCLQVPAGPARSFREAVNALWLLQVGIPAERSHRALGPGRLDQLLYPWYRRDIDRGDLTVPEALELVGCLWLKLNDHTDLAPGAAREASDGSVAVPSVTLGGIGADGEDAVNDLTYVMLRATELLKTGNPAIAARYHRDRNSREYARRVAEVAASTGAVPALCDDLVAIRTLEHQGVATEHARDYAIAGCLELAAAGRTYDTSAAILLNLVSALELALFNGRRGEEQIGPATGDPSSFATFDDFRRAFEAQLDGVIGQAVEPMGRLRPELLPAPLQSSLFQGPLDKGRDLVHGGALRSSPGGTRRGFGGSAEFLGAVEQAVFIERRCTLAELQEALRAHLDCRSPLRPAGREEPAGAPPGGPMAAAVEGCGGLRVPLGLLPPEAHLVAKAPDLPVRASGHWPDLRLPRAFFGEGLPGFLLDTMRSAFRGAQPRQDAQLEGNLDSPCTFADRAKLFRPMASRRA